MNRPVSGGSSMNPVEYVREKGGSAARSGHFSLGKKGTVPAVLTYPIFIKYNHS
jgi:hypothetical protein